MAFPSSGVERRGRVIPTVAWQQGENGLVYFFDRGERVMVCLVEESLKAFFFSVVEILNASFSALEVIQIPVVF